MTPNNFEKNSMWNNPKIRKKIQCAITRNSEKNFCVEEPKNSKKNFFVESPKISEKNLLCGMIQKYEKNFCV